MLLRLDFAGPPHRAAGRTDAAVASKRVPVEGSWSRGNECLLGRPPASVRDLLKKKKKHTRVRVSELPGLAWPTHMPVSLSSSHDILRRRVDVL